MPMPTDDGVVMQLRYELPCAEATGLFAQRLAPLLQMGDVIALKGELGAGKTTFARALIRSLGAVDTEVPSPTFTLAQSYQGQTCNIWHFDLYRLKSADEAAELGIDEMRHDSLVLIEWPERLGDLLPRDRLDVALDYVDRPHARLARLTPRGAMADTMVRCGLA